MRINFVPQNYINQVINGLSALHEHMTKTGQLDANLIKEFMEPIFKEAGYRDKQKKPQNILILHDAGIGDFIIMSAAIREIRRIYPNAHITLLINKTSLAMAELCPYVDEIITSDSNTLKLNNVLGFFKISIDTAKHLLKHRIDIAFNFGQYPSSQLVAYMSGANEIVEERWEVNVNESFKLGLIPMNFFGCLSNFKSDFKKLVKPHLNESNLYILQDYTKTKIKDKRLEVWLSPRDKFVAETILQPFNGQNLCAIVMGGNRNLSCKKWAADNYAKLMNMLLEREKIIFVILGGADEVEEGKIIESLVKSDNLINLTDRISLRQSAAVLNLCDLYIGNDTGLMHAAAAFKIPILSPNCYPADKEMPVTASPQRYYPYAVPSVLIQPRHSLPECKDKFDLSGCTFKDRPHCINQITPEIMLKGMEYLKQRIEQKAGEPLFFS